MSDTHEHSVAFVRTEEVAAKPPPNTAAGPVKWVKDNLFATPANGLLTLIALYVVYLVLSGSLPWILNGIWDSPSLKVCREMLDGETGACFAVLTERWNQLIFGFKYPTDIYWRPGLAFVLLFFAAAPVLFFDLPRKMLIITGLFPFIAYWLIWGGAIWAPALHCWLRCCVLRLRTFRGAELCAWLLWRDCAACVVWIVCGSFSPTVKLPKGRCGLCHRVTWVAFMLNMMLGVTCVSLSVPIGIALALGVKSSMPLIKWICVVFIEFIRGVPLITLLFVASVMLAYLLPTRCTSGSVHSRCYHDHAVLGGLYCRGDPRWSRSVAKGAV